MLSLDGKCYAQSHCELAEGPIWDDQQKELLWLDIKQCKVLRLGKDGSGETVQELTQYIGCMALRQNGGMILGLATGIYLLGKEGEYRKLEVPGLSERVRFNDGKCDGKGRFWAGTINIFPGETGIARLYCVLPNQRVFPILDGVSNSNGLVFSDDLKTLYYIDTPSRRVDAFDIQEDDQGVPSLHNRRTVVAFTDGWPDGMTMDKNGFLWVALWGTGAVFSFDPRNGRCMGSVRIPVKAVSSCCFGGEDMRTLFITTAREGMSEKEEKDAGNVFFARMNVPGVKSHRFLG